MKKVVIGCKQYNDQRWYVSGTIFEDLKITNFNEKESFSSKREVSSKLEEIVEEYRNNGYTVELK